MKEMDRYSPSVDREMLDRYQAVNVRAEKREEWIEFRKGQLLAELERDELDTHWYYDRKGMVKVRTDLAWWVVGEQKEDYAILLGDCSLSSRQMVWEIYAEERAFNEADMKGDF